MPQGKCSGLGDGRLKLPRPICAFLGLFLTFGRFQAFFSPAAGTPTGCCANASVGLPGKKIL
jgi:hypothetical protein